jgi:DNA polymerase-3 subunit gamma/tau
MSSEHATTSADSTRGALALAPEPPRPVAVPTPAPVAIAEPDPITAAAPASSAHDLDAASEAACSALEAQKHTSAAHELADSTWAIAGKDLRIQTAQPASLLPMIFNAEAERIIKSALRANGLGTLKLVILPADPAAAPDKKARAPRSGSVQARAAEHPLVQQAQKLFNAEIRTVMDLRPKD